MKREKLKCQVLHVRACPIEIAVTNINVIYITSPFDIPLPVKRVSEATTVAL